MNYNNWLIYATLRLTKSNTPRLDSEILLSFVIKKTKTFLLIFHETELTIIQSEQLERLLIRRENGEPISYLIGKREFWSLSFFVSSNTLIPRSDSERLIELALQYLPNTPCHILDLGTGCGSLALSLASERLDCIITGIDILSSVLSVALYNMKKLKITNVKFLKSNWFNSLSNKRFSLIMSNPPYIDINDIHLTKGDVLFEPKNALISKKKGLADLATIIYNAPKFLKSKGWLLLEHGWKQGSSVRTLFLFIGFLKVTTYYDYGNNERVTVGYWPY
ncbi:Release factor glutamine methyltransferase [Serratia symbiotica]|nr:Release factor glutamine methyltransferase [Serratia symbiotica]